MTADNKEAAEKSEVLILSVKPQFYAQTIAEIRDCIREEQMVITIAPGKTLNGWESSFRSRLKLSVLCRIHRLW